MVTPKQLRRGFAIRPNLFLEERIAKNEQKVNEN